MLLLSIYIVLFCYCFFLFYFFFFLFYFVFFFFFFFQAEDGIRDLTVTGVQTCALPIFAGAMDNYGGDGAQHNARFWLRPEDQLFLYFPHDLDYFGSTTMAVIGNEIGRASCRERV